MDTAAHSETDTGKWFRSHSQVPELYGRDRAAERTRSIMLRWCCATRVTSCSPTTPHDAGHSRHRSHATANARTREECPLVSRRCAIQSAFALVLSTGLAWPQVFLVIPEHNLGYTSHPTLRSAWRRPPSTCLQSAYSFSFPPNLDFSHLLQPEPVAFPRKALDQRFAVLLLRSTYDAVDALDFIAMVLGFFSC